MYVLNNVFLCKYTLMRQVTFLDSMIIEPLNLWSGNWLLSVIGPQAQKGLIIEFISRRDTNVLRRKKSCSAQGNFCCISYSRAFLKHSAEMVYYLDGKSSSVVLQGKTPSLSLSVISPLPISLVHHL